MKRILKRQSGKCMGMNYVAQKKWYGIKGENFLDCFLFNKTNRCTNFSNLFWLKNENKRCTNFPNLFWLKNETKRCSNFPNLFWLKYETNRCTNFPNLFWLKYETNRCTNFPNLFWLKNEPLHVSGSSSAHHQEFVNCTLGSGICHTV
jgi:hypothetical protein